jgi:catechol 2,3-dioxygenase-like lactoylglutathione lyase family enzyme
MALIKVTDLAYGRLRAPDLDAAEEFLTEFGMSRAERTPTALYMRGTDPNHHIHVTEKGEPGFVGFGYYAESMDDLKRVAKAPGASTVESLDEPGGGKRVRLREPNGYQIEVLYGVKPLKPVTVKRQPLNMGKDALKRAGEALRLPKGASRVKRIGHGVMAAPDVRATVRWFRETLGFICSDDVYEGSKDNLIGSFNRFDRGATYVDHHSFFCIRNARAGLNHLSYEVQDIDDVFMGHEHLAGLRKYEHMWGVGRHLLGSQVFDYWSDPWGRVHEHWSDTDRLNAKNGSNLLPAEEALGSQWGERAPQKFIERVCP